MNPDDLTDVPPMERYTGAEIRLRELKRFIAQTLDTSDPVKDVAIQEVLKEIEKIIFGVWQIKNKDYFGEEIYDEQSRKGKNSKAVNA